MFEVGGAGPIEGDGAAAFGGVFQERKFEGERVGGALLLAEGEQKQFVGCRGVVGEGSPARAVVGCAPGGERVEVLQEEVGRRMRRDAADFTNRLTEREGRK